MSQKSWKSRDILTKILTFLATLNFNHHQSVTFTENRLWRHSNPLKLFHNFEFFFEISKYWFLKSDAFDWILVDSKTGLESTHQGIIDPGMLDIDISAGPSASGLAIGATIMNSLAAGFNFFSLIHVWCFNDGKRRQGFIQKIDHRNMTQDQLINTVNLLEGNRVIRT